jgi:uroporphyrinogen decarboxylase
MQVAWDRWTWKPEPDIEALLATLRGKGSPKVPALEFLVVPQIIAAVLGEDLIPFTSSHEDREQMEASVDQHIRFYHAVGMSAFRAKAILDLPVKQTKIEDTGIYASGQRSWMEEGRGPISNWQEFENYPWPEVSDADYGPIEYAANHMPEGMAIFAKSYGILEQAMWLMGYETFAYALFDQPDLVEAIFSKVAEIYLPFNRALTEIDGVVGLWMGDDMGHRGGTMIHPKHLRELVFPIQRQIAEYCHERDLLFLMHSCGQLEEIMENLIEDVRIDGKHSFEDIITPVESIVAAYSDRISVIGGVDIDLLARGSEDQIRERTRSILEACSPSRSYALGSGNSITTYVPPGSFLVMLDECYRFNQEQP